MPNLTFTRIGVGGTVCMTASVSTHMILDVTGVLPATAITPASSAGAIRALDTRGVQLIAAGNSICVATGGTPGAHVIANATIANPTGDWYATVHSGDANWQASSTNNFTIGTSLSNLGITSVGPDGQVCMTSSVSTHMILDVTGYPP